MARIDQLEREKLGARQQQLYDEIMRTRPRGKLSGPFSVWIHRPDIAEPANALANCFRIAPKLDKRLIEVSQRSARNSDSGSTPRSRVGPIFPCRQENNGKIFSIPPDSACKINTLRDDFRSIAGNFVSLLRALAGN